MMKNLACVVLFFAGCSSPPSSLGSVGQGIIGGAEDSIDTSVVLIIAQTPGMQGLSLCTGEVVSPHVVLTAAHCVDPSVIGQNSKFGVFLGDDLSDPEQQMAGNILKVASIHFDPQFDKSTLPAGHDIGAVVTSTPINRPPLKMNRTPLTAAMKGQMLRLVGFGISAGDDAMGSSAGVRREVSTPLIDFDDLLFSFGTAAKNTCEGDSGGPAFLTLAGQEVIVGVTSFGAQGCAMGGYDTRVDLFASSFVDPIIAMAEGQPLPAPPGNGTPLAMVGTDCTEHAQCKSGVCAKNGESGYCTQACDPAAQDSCPSGLSCGEIDSQHYCVQSSGGCSFGASATPTGTFFLFALTALVLVLRRRA